MKVQVSPGWDLGLRPGVQALAYHGSLGHYCERHRVQLVAFDWVRGQWRARLVSRDWELGEEVLLDSFQLDATPPVPTHEPEVRRGKVRIKPGHTL